jgi:hypothetical protein
LFVTNALSLTGLQGGQYAFASLSSGLTVTSSPDYRDLQVGGTTTPYVFNIKIQKHPGHLLYTTMDGRRISVSSTTQLVPTNSDIELTTMAAHVPGHLEEPSFPDLDRVSTELVGIANTIQKPSSNHTDPGMYEPLLSAHRE